MYIWVYLEDKALVDLFMTLELAFNNLPFEENEWIKLDDGLFKLIHEEAVLERVWVNDK